MNTTTRTTRRDEVKPGDIFQSSHGYRLLVTEVWDGAEVRTDDRHVQITGHLHADPNAPLRNERYPAGSTVEVETLTWGQAVDQAMTPTDLDISLQTSPMFRREIVDGKIADWNLIRERAALAYLKAHAGVTVEVSHGDPAHISDRTRLVYRTTGVAQVTLVSWPIYGDDASTVHVEHGFVISGQCIPFAGVSSIRTESDRSIQVL